MERSKTVTQGEVTERFENEHYKKNYYGGDAAGAVQYIPQQHPEYETIDGEVKEVKHFVWDPMIHRFDLPPEHKGMLLTVFV